MLAFSLFVLPMTNVAWAASENENQDSYYALEFEKFSEQFEQHIQQLNKCIAEMEAYENQTTEFVFKGEDCSRLDDMRTEAQQTYNDARALLEKYIQWIGSLTEKTFAELVKLSNSSQSMLLTSMRSYLDKQNEVLLKSERIMQKQTQRLEEMEQRIEDAEKQLNSSQGG